MFLDTWQAGLNADCVKFVPNTDLSVLSCYQLDEAENKRKGKLILTRFDADSQKTEKIDEVDGIPGVFDFNWLPKNQNIAVLAVSDGPPLFYCVDQEKRTLQKVSVDHQGEEFDESQMTLSVTSSYFNNDIFTSTNRGWITRFTFDDDNNVLMNEGSWRAHDAEIWYVSTDRWNKNILYSGSDDMLLKLWDVREDPASAISTLKHHEAGVCCVDSSPWDENQFISGSYDENVRLWDKRNTSRPLKKIQCGSGAWRISWHPKDKNLIGVAAMRAGYQIIDLAEEAVVYTENTGNAGDHVAYGIDWCPLDQYLLASCSFYNQQGQYWRYK